MKNESIDKILGELDKTKQLILKFRDTGKIPDIERDIVLAQLRDVYSFIQLVKLEVVEPNIPEKETVVLVIEPEPHIISPETQPVTMEFDEVQHTVHVAPVKEIPVVEEKEIPPVHIPQSQTQHQTQTKSSHGGKMEILAEKFQTQSFLNDALAQFQNVSDLSKKMQNQPLKDIFSAINLNDKFLFIKELFTNDAALYQSTVEKLNSAGNFNDAIRYLDGNFTWDFSDPMVQNFLELVRRRFL